MSKTNMTFSVPVAMTALILKNEAAVELAGEVGLVMTPALHKDYLWLSVAVSEKDRYGFLENYTKKLEKRGVSFATPFFKFKEEIVKKVEKDPKSVVSESIRILVKKPAGGIEEISQKLGVSVNIHCTDGYAWVVLCCVYDVKEQRRMIEEMKRVGIEPVSDFVALDYQQKKIIQICSYSETR